MKFDWDAFYETIKLPLRLLVFACIGYLLDFAIVYFSQSSISMAPVIAGLLIIIDKYLHEVRSAEAKKPLEGWDRGLLPF